MPIIDNLFGLFGYSKLPKPTQQQEAETRDLVIRKITAGIGYDLQWYNNWVSDFFNPNPVMRTGKWRQEGGYRAFEAMDADAKIYNAMSTRKEASVSRRYYVRSARPGDQKEDFKAAFVAWNLDHIKQLTQKKREIRQDLDYGFSVTEMIFDRQDVDIPDKTTKKNGVTTTIKGGILKDAVVIKDLETKIPSAFSFDASGRMMIMDTQNTGGNIPVGVTHRYVIPEELKHFLVLTHDPRNGNRYGWPLKASFFFDYLMKKAGKIYRMIFVEKYGMPFVHGKYPANVNDTGSGSTAEFEQKLQGLQKNSYLMTPQEFSIEFVEAIKSSTVDVYQNLMDFCDGNISEVTLGHKHATDSAAVGSFSSAEVKEGALRQDKLESDAGELDGLFNDQMIPVLIDLNFTSNGLYPYVETDVQPESDKNKRIFQFSAASNLGLDLSKSQIRDEMKLNEPEDENDILRPVGVDLSPTNVGEGNSDPNLGGENDKNTEISDGVRKSAQKMSTSRRNGITMTVNI
jgi:phage gp29-like protein